MRVPAVTVEIQVLAKRTLRADDEIRLLADGILGVYLHFAGEKRAESCKETSRKSTLKRL